MKKNYNKGFGIVGILVAVFVVVAVGFITYNIGKNKGTTENSDQINITIPNNEVPSDSIVETAPPSDNINTQISDCNKNSTPLIIVTNPKGGETYTVGQKINITWTSCNVQNVFIGWRQGGHDQGLFSETPTPASNGSYQWTVPSYNGVEGSYWLSVQEAVSLPNNKWTTGISAKSIPFNISSGVINLSTFSSKYISPYPGQWPPIVQYNTAAYSCSTISRDVFGTPMTLAGTQKNINGRTFCIYSFSDAGAGHAAGVYTYITANPNKGGTNRVDFRIDWPNGCGGYGTTGDPQYDQCKNDQSIFFNNLDAYIASLM